MSNREYKSDVFSMLMEEPERALEVFNALNDTSYDDPSLVIMQKLENGISLTIRNDASFIIDSHINVYEHQSTFNPNMPLRSLIYISSLYKTIVKTANIQSRSLVKIPTPHCIVFYNGLESQPEKTVLKLSDAYIHKESNPDLELYCTVYNINSGNNDGLLKRSSTLYEYMYFVDKVRYYNNNQLYNLEDAIDMAIKDCIGANVLMKFLTERRDEVKKNMVLDYTHERILELERRDAREEGFADGKAEGKVEGKAEGKFETLLALIKNGMLSLQDAASFANLSVEELKSHLDDLE